MSFPTDSLDLVVTALIGGQWRDLTTRLIGEPVKITRGARDGAVQVSAGRCTLTLDDDDGALTPLNPLGVYYPHVRRGAEFHVQVRRGRDTFARTSAAGWGTADSGQVWAAFGAGGTVQATDTTVTPGYGSHHIPAANAYRATWLDTMALRDAEVLATFDTVITDVTGAQIEPAGVMLRAQDISTYYLARVHVSAAEAVSLEISHTVTGVLATVSVPGLVWAGQACKVRAGIAGSRLRMKVWDAATTEPAGWQLEVTDTTDTTPGGVGIRSGAASGNTNTKPVEFRYSDLHILAPRFTGTASSYRPRIVPKTGGTMANAQTIELGGPLRQLDQGTSPARSALGRTIPATTDPIGYWPLEDGVDSTQAASGLAGGVPATAAVGIMDFVDETPPGGAGSAKPDVDADNQLSAPLAAGSATAWQMSIWTKGIAATAPAAYIPLEVRTNTGKILRFGRQDVGTDELILQYDSEDQSSPTHSSGLATGTAIIDPAWHLMQASFTQNGADVDVEFWFDGVPSTPVTWTGLTIGAPISIRAIGRFGGLGAVSQNMSEIYIAHIAVHNGATIIPLHTAGLGYPGEDAADRLTRTAAEEGAALQVQGDAGDTPAMGVQAAATLLEILRECEAADGGVLHESSDDIALRYRTRTSLYNQNPTLTANLATYHTAAGTSAQVLTPVYDDQGLRNDIQVTRTGGSSARAVNQTSIDADGRYDESVQVNVATDAVLPDIAGWRLHLGTVDETRNPALPIDLAANPDLIEAWLSTDIGDRVQRTNAPAPQAGTIDQIMNGYTETLGRRRWDAVANCSPARPWDVATADGEQRVPADGSTLNSTLALGAMSMSLASTAENGVWSTDAADFPLDVRVGGERITLSAITGSSSPQTGTISARGVNGVTRAWDAGTEVDVWAPAVAPL